MGIRRPLRLRDLFGPACERNSLAGDYVFDIIAAKYAEIQKGISRKHARFVNRQEWTREELASMSRNFRLTIGLAEERPLEVLGSLCWVIPENRLAAYEPFMRAETRLRIALGRGESPKTIDFPHPSGCPRA